MKHLKKMMLVTFIFSIVTANVAWACAEHVAQKDNAEQTVKSEAQVQDKKA